MSPSFGNTKRKLATIHRSSSRSSFDYGYEPDHDPHYNPDYESGYEYGYELAYASPVVVQVEGKVPDTDTACRHIKKINKECFNDEIGKLGKDGRKRRLKGNSDDEGELTKNGFHAEDLRVGGPYLCPVPTEAIPLDPHDQRSPMLEFKSAEGQELCREIKAILQKWKCRPDHLSIVKRQSAFEPKKDPVITLLVESSEGNKCGTWLDCAKKLRELLIDRKLGDISVEIAHPFAFEPASIFAVFRKDQVCAKWNKLLADLQGQLEMNGVCAIGCFRRGRSKYVCECIPTVLITVQPNYDRDWKLLREEVVGILRTYELDTLAVEISRGKIERGEKSTQECETTSLLSLLPWHRRASPSASNLRV